MRKIFLSISLITSVVTNSGLAQTNSEVKPTNTSSTTASITSPASNTTFVPKVSGLLNLRYQYSTENQNYLSGKNGMDLRRAFVVLTGNATQNITYRVMADLSGSPKMLDAYMEWKPCKTFNVQAGQFRTALSIENLYLPPALETVDNSQVINALVYDIETYKNTGRDLGLSVFGSLFPSGKGFDFIEYKLAVTNGNIINSTDNNKSKDYSGALYIQPINGLSVGGSAYFGKFGPEATKYTRNRYAVGTKYEKGKLMVRSEYIAGKTAAVESAGFYATAAYYVTKKIQPVLKYDTYKSNNAVATTPITNYIAGVNYWITPKTRLQLNYTHKDFKDTSKSDYDYVVAQLLLSF